LFADALIKKESIRYTGPDTTDISQMKLLCLIEDLIDREIIINEKDALFAFYKRKNL
jgi:hypothetical protein